MKPAARNLHRPLLHVAGVLGLLALVLLLYGRAFRLQLVGDDFIWLYDGYATHRIADLFAIHYFEFVRPMSQAYFWAGTRLLGLERGGWQAVQLALHAGTAVLLARWVAGCTRRPVAGLAAAAAWLCIARHVESVCWLAAVGEVLAAPCMLGCLLLHRRWWLRRESLSYLGALACFEGALLSKESAISLLALLVVQALVVPASDDVGLAGSAEGAAARQGALPPRRGLALRSLVPYAVLLVLTAGSEWWLIEQHRGELGYSTEAFRTVGFYGAWARYTLTPWMERGWVPALHGFLLSALGPEGADLAWGALLAAYALAIIGLMRRPSTPGSLEGAVALLLAWVPLAALPYAAFLPQLEPYDRYLYLPTMGVAGVVGLGGALVWQRASASRAGRGACLMLGGALLVRQVAAVRSEVLDAVARTPSIPHPTTLVPRLLTGLAPAGRVYSYVPASFERYPASALALYGGLARERVLDWYEMLREGGLGEGDKAIFYSTEDPQRFTDLTDEARRCLRAAGAVRFAREIPGELRKQVRLVAGWQRDVPPVQPAGPEARIAALASWTMAPTRPGPDAPGAPGSPQAWLASPPLAVSPLLLVAVEVRWARPPVDDEGLFVGWSPPGAASEPASGGAGMLEAPSLRGAAAMRDAVSPLGNRAAEGGGLWFFPSLKASFMREPRWERLWLGMPRELADSVESVRVYGLGPAWDLGR